MRIIQGSSSSLPVLEICPASPGHSITPWPPRHHMTGVLGKGTSPILGHAVNQAQVLQGLVVNSTFQSLHLADVFQDMFHTG